MASTPPAPALARVEAGFRRATRYHLSGRNDEALAAYEVVLGLSAGHVGALVNSAVLLAERHTFHEAASRLRRAVAVDSNDAQAHGNLGLVLRQMGDLSGSFVAYETAARCDPNSALRWRDYANSASELLRPNVALAAFERALEIAPHDASVRTDYAAALRAVMRPDDAIVACYEALNTDPAYFPAHLRLAGLLKEARRWVDAESAYTTALARFDNHPALLIDLSLLYIEWGDLEKARAIGEILCEANPESPDGHNVLGCVLLELGRTSEARMTFERILAMDPSNVSAAWNLSSVALVEGDLERGFAGFERRRTMPGFLLRTQEVPGTEWAGEPLDGKTIFIHEEQGLGDLIQFVRYAADLKRLGAKRIIVEAPIDAAALIATVPGVDAISLRGDPFPVYDYFVPLMTIPFRVGTRLTSIPAACPYLSATSGPLTTLIRSIPGRLKVGIVWGGNPRNPRDRARALPLPALLSALHLHGVKIFSLQKGAHASALAPWRNMLDVTDLDTHLHSLADTAEAITALDLVISVCTSVAHLAGGLAHPTWTLLSHSADWRWFRDRDDSPWYPSMRLFRQDSPGDWTRPLGQVCTALQAMLLTKP